MTRYTPLSDAVGLLETTIVTYHWVRSAEGEKVFTRSEARPLRCLVWDPNRTTNRDRLLVRARTLAEAR